MALFRLEKLRWGVAAADEKPRILLKGIFSSASAPAALDQQV